MNQTMRVVATPEQRRIRQLELDAEARDEADARERAKKQTTPFVQLTDPDGLIAMQVICGKSRSAAQLFTFMMQHMNRNNCLVASMVLFSEALGLSYRSIQRAVKILDDNNYISILKVGNTNAYHLNKDLCWKAWKTGKAHAVCQGTILLSLSEQQKSIQDKVKKQLLLFSKK